MGFEVVTIRQAAKMLGVKVRTIRGWIHANKINAVKNASGYKWLIPICEVQYRMEGKNANQD